MHFKCIVLIKELYQTIVLVGRMFTNVSEDQGSIPGLVIPKTQKCYLILH